MVSPLFFTCLVIVLGIGNVWMLPSMYDNDQFGNETTSSSIFDNMRRAILAMSQQLDKLLRSPLFDMTDDRNLTSIWKKLEDVNSNCTTRTDPSLISSDKQRRKRHRPIETMICVKKLIADGKLHVQEETNVTDTNGLLISSNRIYHIIDLESEDQIEPTNNKTNMITY
jgi:hypothetical protein